MDALRGRWRADCARVARAGQAEVDEVGVRLLRRWREPHRRYHDATHLAEVLTAVDTLCGSAGVSEADHAVAALAGWFHDAVYSAEEHSTNEAASADVAREDLGRLGVRDEIRSRVVLLVLDTVAHDLSPDGAADPARVVLHDADLWILASPVPRFDEYCRQVRDEYAHVPAAAYAAGRSEVLRPFLVRPHVYASAHARSQWEDAARENLARELTRLAG
jgi:predicted metal-dependent HD superfamily phosphohydrolase